jgi:alpha-tubulin suppressor-like RCC1 family protein
MRSRWASAVVVAACWSGGEPPLPRAPTSPPAVPYVSVGYLHHCVLGPSGAVTCFGNNNLDQLRVPADRLVAVSAGLYHSCGLTPRGRVICWGSDRGPYPNNATPNIAPPPIAIELAVVAAGDGFTCGLDARGEIVAWGRVPWKRLPATPMLDKPAPPPPGPYVAIAAGYNHACALRREGEVVCFGETFDRQPRRCREMENVPDGLCRPDEMISLGWTRAPRGLRAVAIAAGASHTCALARGGTVTCWGADGWGDGNSMWAGQTRVPTALKDVVEISAGGGHSCARRRDGSVACWGDVASPTGRFTQISSGATYACGVRGGAVACSNEPGW